MSNEYQDALDNVLKDNIKAYSTRSDIHKDIRLLKQLVDKEKPMKVSQNNSLHYICPVCKTPISLYMMNYCSLCGQRLVLDGGKNE